MIPTLVILDCANGWRINTYIQLDTPLPEVLTLSINLPCTVCYNGMNISSNVNSMSSKFKLTSAEPYGCHYTEVEEQ